VIETLSPAPGTTPLTQVVVVFQLPVWADEISVAMDIPDNNIIIRNVQKNRKLIFFIITPIN
jgi:hypothetical protein